MSCKSLIPILALLSAGSAAIASADALPTALVRFNDLDLSRPADVARLQHRIDRAVQEVCGDVMGEPIELRDEVRKCRATARGRADVQIARAVDRATRQASLRSAVAAR